MKILSKRTDYYDHLVGYYGYDQTIVYDRRNPSPIRQPKKGADGQYSLYICGTCYPFIIRGQHVIFDEKDARLKDWNDKNYIQHRKGKLSLVNVENRQPVLLKDWWGIQGIPNLGDCGIAAIIEAHEMYQMIYTFLGWLKDNPEKPNTQTDKDKIKAHGFDLKHSFRPNIKNE